MQSQFLPATPSMHGLSTEPSFRLALKLIAAMYGMSASTDVPVLGGGVNNIILRDILNGLVTDACNWVSVLQIIHTTSSSQHLCCRASICMP